MSSSTAKTSTIDRDQLRVLLKCYFRLSMRGRVTKSLAGGRGGGKPRGLVFVLVMYAFVGLMTGMFALSAKMDVFTYTVLVHSMTFFVVGLALTSESGDILFNMSESDVLVHRPIHPRTLLLAKSLNLIAFSLILAGALNLFPTFFGLAARDAYPWFPVVHLLSMTALCVFCAAAVVCTYGLVIKYLDREKFDNFAAWSQVALSILFIFGYQIMPRLMQRFNGLSLDAYAKYLFPLPPAWFAGFDATAASSQTGLTSLGLAAVGLGATVALGYMAIDRLAPSYGEGLTRLSERVTASSGTEAAKPRRQVKRNLIQRFWLSDPVEWQAFRLAAAYMRRNRDIKLRLYPALSMFIVFPLIGLLDRGRGGFTRFVPLMTTWMLGTLPVSALENLRISSDFAAADLFYVAPLTSAAALFHGVRKAAIYYLLVPAIGVAWLLLFLLTPEARSSFPLALAGLIAIPTISLMPGLTGRYLPLSRPLVRGEQSSRNMGLMMLSMFGMVGILGLSWVAQTFGFFWILLAVELVLFLTLHWYLRHLIARRPLGAPD